MKNVMPGVQWTEIQTRRAHRLSLSTPEHKSSGNENRATLPLMQLFEPRAAFIHPSIYRCRHCQRSTNNRANAG